MPIKSSGSLSFKEALQCRMYDLQLIFGFLAWFIPNKKSRVMCSEACTECLACMMPTGLILVLYKQL